MALSDEQLNQLMQKYKLIPASNSAQNGNSLRGSALLDSLDTNSPSEESKPDGFLKGLAKGIAKPFVEIGTSAYNVGSSVGKLVQGDVQGASEAIGQSRNIPFFGETKPAFTGQETTGGALKKMAGYGTEIASTIAPMGEIGVGTKALGKTALKYGTTSALGDLGHQLQGDKPINKMEVLKSGLIGSAVPVVGRGASKLIKGVGNVGAELLGKTTGTSGDVIKEAFNNPNVIKFSRQAGSKGANDLQKQALEEAQQGLQKMVKAKGDEYVSALEKIKSNPQEMQGVMSELKNKINQHLENYDITVGKDGKLDFSNSALDHSNALQKAYNTINTWTDNTAAGLDRLKKKLGQFADQVPSTEQRGGMSNILNDLKNSTRQHLNEKVPGYKEMTSKYAQASDLHDEIKRALSLGDNASQDTAIRKLMSTTKENNDLRKEFVDILSGSSGTDIRGKLAGSALAPNFAGGLSGKIAQAAIPGAGIAHYLNPGAVPLIGAYIAASSPRLMGEFTTLLGKATKQMVKANKFTPQIENSLRILLQRSLNKK